MAYQKDNKNDTKGWIGSIIIHGVLLVLFLFILAWQAPDPPIEEYGILINLGYDDAGSGQQQPETKPEPVEEQQEEAPQEEVEEEQVVDEPVDEVVEEVVEEVTEEVEEVIEETIPDTPTQSEPSPVVKKDPPKKEVKKEPDPPVKKPEVAKHTMPASSKGNNSAASSSQGDQKDKTGDQGKPAGSIDSDKLYGSQGGGGGSSLDMAGWAWDQIPKPKDNTGEGGKIVFEIEVDEDGEIIRIKTIVTTVSPSVKRIYEEEVRKLTFHKTSGGGRTAATSTGRITFILKAN